MSEEKRKLLEQIRTKLQSVIDTHHDFAEKTKDMLDSLINLHVFDPDIDMEVKGAALDEITYKLVKMAAAKKDGNSQSQMLLKRELIQLYKELLK